MSPTTVDKPARRKPHELEGQVVGLLRASGVPMGGQEISRRLSTSERRVVPMLVFRALAQLIKQQAVCRVESFSAYVIAPEEPSITLLCTDCRSCRLVADAIVIAGLERLASTRSFAPHRCVVEVHGRCPRCDERSRSLPTAQKGKNDSNTMPI